MTVGDGHSGVGATSFLWDRDVAAVVRRLTGRFPAVACNTYECHPFCGPPGNREGWQRRSVDVWGSGGRGDPIPPHMGELVVDYLFTSNEGPAIRHWIYRHRWWLSGVGYREWAADDHSGRLRHVHVTYLPVPPIG